MTTADRGFTWSDEETALLLEFWGGNDAQYELSGQKRNFVVYEKISETMTNMGFIRTASQCREKIKRMKREYTVTKQHNEKSDGTKKNMRFFEQFEKVLLERQGRIQKEEAALKEKSAAVLLQPAVEEAGALSNNNWTLRNARKMRKIAPKPGQTATEKDSENPWTPDVVLVEDNAPSTSLYKNQAFTQPATENGEIPLKKKQKLTSRMSIYKCMMDSLTLKFMKYQAEADTKLLKRFETLENERADMHERTTKMWFEFEERQRASERQHEIEVMNAFQGIINELKVNKTKT